MSKYTPGPWEFVLNEDFPFGYQILAPNGQVLQSCSAICHATGQKTRLDNERGIGFKAEKHSGFGQEQAAAAISTQDANGRLMASAPELLEALEGALAWAEYNGMNTQRSTWNWMPLARAAIQKAKGEVKPIDSDLIALSNELAKDMGEA